MDFFYSHTDNNIYGMDHKDAIQRMHKQGVRW